MDIINFIEVKTDEVSIEDLNKYHEPEKIFGFCKRCPNYNKIWSCPPHKFETSDYIDSYNYCSVVRVKIHIKEESRANKEAKKLSRKISDNIRLYFDKSLIDIERNFKDTKALYAGSCLLCNNCTRTNNSPCIKQDKMRYSLEALGFQVSGICEMFNDKILWSSDKLPEYLMFVGAVLSKGKLDSELIKAYIKTGR
ncbi:DUF2284 domain-containing protein [Abyssisolibacter fermentans]|uniref:DUF2284 domain-containing protein n=1 Tax=Abyssisolibacter fermentans TaxID=1766203 RepID=UPI000832CFD8|nr:DUF2284 domain-containing protein [Abyssisolibacter fermentans]